MEKSYVYIIQELNELNTKRIKIGKANKPTKRLRTLQTGNPYTLTLLGTIECEDSEEANTLERQIHARLSKDRRRGEWFINSLDVNYFVTNAPLEFGEKYMRYFYSVPTRKRKEK